MDRTWWNMSSLGYNRERNMHYWAGEQAWIEHGGTRVHSVITEKGTCTNGQESGHG